MNVFYKISIDRVNVNYISGWCFHRLWREKPLALQCIQNGRLVAETKADKLREDLQALKIHPSGRCGFEIVLENSTGFDSSLPISLRLKGSTTKLAEFYLDDQIQDSRPGLYDFIARLLPSKKKSLKTAIFMHIPKTAGTTFNTLAQSLYPRSSTINHIELLPVAKYQGLSLHYKYISGHLRYGLLNHYFASEACGFYTILREPYAQLHSHLRWLVQTAANPDEKYFKTTNRAIYDLGCRLGKLDFGNLELVSEFIQALTFTEASFVDNLQTRYFLEDQPARVTEIELERALVHSRVFDLIGITENYDSFVKAFVEANNLKVEKQLGKINVSRSAPLYEYQSDTMKEIMKPLVHADLVLYKAHAGEQP